MDAARARVMKKARQEDRERSLEKRTRYFLSKIIKKDAKPTAVPTPGLVSGDFCSTSTKSPRMSATKLCKRVMLWRTLDTGSNLSHTASLFMFACERKLHLRQRHEISTMVHALHQSLDKVVLSEGHRVLTFLSPMERLLTSKAMPSTEHELHGLPIADMSEDMYALCRYTKKRLEKMQADEPVLRKLIIGKTSAASWDEVLAMLNSRSGHVIPRRIEHFGIPRVFEMLCAETPRWKRKANLTGCVLTTGSVAPSYALMETLMREYVDNDSLADFQSIDHIVRIFHGKRIAGPNILYRFRLFRRRMEDLVYEFGQPWAEAAYESYHTFFFTCACGNTSAKLCALRMCRICCEKDTSVTCVRHRKHVEV